MAQNPKKKAIILHTSLGPGRHLKVECFGLWLVDAFLFFRVWGLGVRVCLGGAALPRSAVLRTAKIFVNSSGLTPQVSTVRGGGVRGGFLEITV